MQQIKVIKKYSLSTKGMITQPVWDTYDGTPSSQTERHPSTALCNVRTMELAKTGSSYQSSSSKLNTKRNPDSRRCQMKVLLKMEGAVGQQVWHCQFTHGVTVQLSHGKLQTQSFTNMRALCLYSIILSYNNCYTVLTLINFVCHVDFISSYEEICLSVIPPLCSGTKGVYIYC